MNSGTEQIDRRDSADAERERPRGVIGGIKADFGRPPRRGLGSAVAFAVSCALVGFAAVSYLVTGEELRQPLPAVLAGQWFMVLAEVLPARFVRAAPALRVLCIAIFAGGAVSWWLA